MKSRIRNSVRSLNRHLGRFALIACIWNGGMQVAQAEGSRTLYPSGTPNTSSRANIEWRSNVYGGLLLRRTLLKVYANAGENILLGSSAVGVGNGDILVFDPGRVSGSVGSESIPATANFLCSSQTGKGKITSRALELAGPRAISGTGNPTGYIPCYYTAPKTGVYDVVFYGPSSSLTAEIAPTGEVALSSSNNFDSNQGTSVAAWDVTVRSSDLTSTQDLNGRLFAYYYALFTGINGRPLNFPVYPVTNDGYGYKITLRGLDPNGFLLYGNQVGFFDSDGKTPLYHDILGSDGQVSSPEGGVSIARPQFATFLNPSDPNVLPNVELYNTNGNSYGTGVPIVPIAPGVDSLNFLGTVGANTSIINQGGTFTFNSSAGNYQLVISRDGINFDPTNSSNRVLRGILATSGSQSVDWDGKDNSGAVFPVGNYSAQIQIHAGEYHFPTLDAENNVSGGPTIQLLNGSNPLGNTTSFYDDRGYKTSNGTTVGTVGAALCGTAPPTTINSNPLTGFDTTTNQRAYGKSGNSGNTNAKCTGSFGDTKGLDIWTYFPSAAKTTPVTIISASPSIRLVKRLTKIQSTVLSNYVDVVTGARAIDDNASSWINPTVTATKSDGSGTTPNFSGLLQGAIDSNTLPASQQPKPSDEVEYAIYFLSDGGKNANNVSLCDFLPANTTYVSGTLQLALGSGAPVTVTDTLLDSDGGFYSAAPTLTPNPCAGGVDNLRGAIVVNVGTVQRSTGVGTPSASYGLIRFRAKIN
jgi:uncharacterized repeat protein (TIGR01451 family)